MKALFLLGPVLALLSGCSLVTVPVKTVGSVTETTVKTTGKVIRAPFEAIGRGSDDDDD